MIDIVVSTSEDKLARLAHIIEEYKNSYKDDTHQLDPITHCLYFSYHKEGKKAPSVMFIIN